MSLNISRRAVGRACRPVEKFLLENLEQRRLLAGNGLQAEYFNGKDFNSLALTRIDPTINFDWRNGSPGAGVNSNFFSARWTGYVVSPSTGNFTFHTQSDDGIRLWINDQLVIDNWTDHASTENSGSVQLVADQPNTIKVEYYEGINDALARLSWSSATTTRQVVPTTALFTPDSHFGPPPSSQLPVVEIATNKLQMNELESDYATITATRHGNTDSDLTVLLSLSGTATHGVDYSMPTTIVIPAGEISATARLVAIEDNLHEPNESIIITIAPSSHYLLMNKTVAITTIVDDDAPVIPAYGGLQATYFNGRNFETPVLERIDPQINFDWGYGGPTPGLPADNFSVRWEGLITPVVTGLNTFYTHSDDGVRLWIDDQLIIDQWNDHAPTEHVGSINLISGKAYPIRMEYYERGNGAVAQLRWSAPGLQKTVVSSSQLSPRVPPENNLPTVTIKSSINQATEGKQPFNFTVSRTGNIEQPLLVHLTYGGTATLDDIQDSFPAVVTLPAGESSITISRYAAIDKKVEGPEFITPAIAANPAYNIGENSSVTLHIVDDDFPPTGLGQGLRAEYFNGRNFNTHVVDRIDPTVNFNWGYNSPASGVGSDNFSARWTGSVQPPATGEWSFFTTSDDGVRLWVNGQLIIDQWNDHAATEHRGTIHLVGGVRYAIRMEYYEAGNGAVAELRWSGPTTPRQIIPAERLYETERPTVRVVANDQEREGEGPLTFTLIVVGEHTSPLTVGLGYDGTATAADFVGGLPSSVVIPVGVTQYDVNLMPLDDGIIEELETLEPFVKTDGTFHADNGGYRVLRVVSNDLNPPTMYVFAERNSSYENGPPVEFTFVRRGDNSAAITVPLTYTGSASSNDFASPLPTSITIPAGEHFVVLPLYAVEDNIVENVRALTVHLGAGPGYIRGNATQATVYIDDARPIVRISSDDTSAIEGGDSASFTVSRQQATDEPLELAIGYTGKATPSDFEGGLPTRVVIPAGQTSATVILQAKLTSQDEGVEDLQVFIGALPAYAVDPLAASVTIHVYERELPVAALSAYSGHVAAEGGNNVIIAAGLNSGNAAEDVTVYLSYSGTATSDDFLDPLPASYTIPKGTVGVDLHLRVKDDNLVEGDEVLTVHILPHPNYQVSSMSQYSYLVRDND